jgi:anti-sigma regulatory factor (Ser/Thr protein kinase)
VPSRPATLRLRAEPSEVTDARRWAVRAAVAAGMDPERATDVGLAAAEALANAVMHAYPGREPGWIDLELHEEGDRLLLVVCDDGVGMRTRSDSPGAGYGLTLIGAISVDVRRDRSPSGGVRLTIAFER